MNADANKKIEELSQVDAHAIADLAESKYFLPLKHLLEALDAGAMTQLKDHKKPDAELRKWQGVCEGLANVSLWIEAIAKQVKSGNKTGGV